MSPARSFHALTSSAVAARCRQGVLPFLALGDGLEGLEETPPALGRRARTAHRLYVLATCLLSPIMKGGTLPKIPTVCHLVAVAALPRSKTILQIETHGL